jgi:hypothetical protein
MKNPDNLLFFANVLARLFVGLTHLVTALNTLNNINIIPATSPGYLAPGRSGILHPR